MKSGYEASGARFSVQARLQSRSGLEHYVNSIGVGVPWLLPSRAGRPLVPLLFWI